MFIIFGFISMHLSSVNKAHQCLSGSLKYFRMVVVLLMLMLVVVVLVLVLVVVVVVSAVVMTHIADVVTDRDESVHQCTCRCL